MALALLFFALSLSSLFSSKATSQNFFKCSSRPTCHCQALADYVSPNRTAISSIQSLFDVKDLRALLGANNLPPTTPRNYEITSKQQIKIPFPCYCSNGTGISNKTPIYKVVKDDGLYHIANDVYSGLMPYEEIAKVNNISNVNLILIGQELWIPLPCSCDEVEGESVVHYAYVVKNGEKIDTIARRFGTSGSVLRRLNRLGGKQLNAGAVLDVPLKACKSRISKRSLDSQLLVAEGAYVLTANNCIKCSCNSANNEELKCEPSGLEPNKASGWSKCPQAKCEGSNLFIGNTTSSGCNRITCAYAGYNKTTILATMVKESATPPPDYSRGFIKVKE